MFNDYFDNIDGTDSGNYNYFQQVSGGSRAIELGLISISKTKSSATSLMFIAILFGTTTLFGGWLSSCYRYVGSFRGAFNNYSESKR